MLQALVADYKEEYDNLTKGEAKELIQLHEEHKSTLATARCVNVRSRINDTMQTLMAMETEVSVRVLVLFGPTDIPFYKGSKLAGSFRH